MLVCDYPAGNGVHLAPPQNVAVGPYRTDPLVVPVEVVATRSACSHTHRHLIEHGEVPVGWDRSPWGWELAGLPGLADGHPVP